MAAARTGVALLLLRRLHAVSGPAGRPAAIAHRGIEFVLFLVAACCDLIVLFVSEPIARGPGGAGEIKQYTPARDPDATQRPAADARPGPAPTYAVWAARLLVPRSTER